MKLSDGFRTILVEEIEYVVKCMNEVSGARELLYYFSAIYGTIQRIYNIEYNDELVFCHFITQATHDGFSQRLSAITQKADNAILISDEQFKRLIQLSDELGKRIKEDKSTETVLRKFIVLLVSTSGNGYYLMKKGLLKP